jgi:hypothetical protein
MKEIVDMIKNKIQELIMSVITAMITHFITEKQRRNLLKSELDKMIKK